MGGLLVGRFCSVETYYLYDVTGNVALTVSHDGGLQSEYRYDVYGNILQTYFSQNDHNRFRYSTKYSDEVSSVYFGYRHYWSQIGLFGSRDLLAEFGGVGLYTYVNNDPVLHIDVLGMNPFMGAVGKCAGQLILHHILEIAERMLAEYNACADIKDAIIETGIDVADTSWCSGNSTSSSIPLEIEPKTVIGIIAGCIGDLLKDKTIGIIMNAGHFPSQLQEVITGLMKSDADKISEAINYQGIHPEIYGQCSSRDSLAWEMRATFKGNLGGVPLTFDPVVISSGTCEGRNISAICCGCGF